METKPLACKEHDPVDLHGDQVDDSEAQGELGVNVSDNLSLQDQKDPRAEPQDDLDTLKPRGHNETLQEKHMLSGQEEADVTTLENQESTEISLDARGNQEMAKLGVSHFSPPFTALTKEEVSLKAGISSPEGEDASCVSDSGIVLDTPEPPLSPDSHNSQEHQQTPPLTEPVHKNIDSTLDKKTDDTNPNSSPDGFDNNKAENNTPQPAAAGMNSTTHYSPSDRNNADDVYTISSLPSADESEEENDVSNNIMSCQKQPTKQELKNRTPRQPNSVSLSDITLKMLAVTQAKLREELLAQIRRELALRGANQEAAQQVLSQALPPLSTVAMELPNKGGADCSQGSSYVVAVREGQSKSGERTDGENAQTGGQEEKIDGGLDKSKAVGKQQREGLRFSKAVQTRKPKPKRFRFVPSKHIRMESDSCDDSQSDSGVSADFSPCNTLEGNTTVSPGATAPAIKETPIEREIRRAVEREYSLRRSRGLLKQPTLPEYVEIPVKKTVLFQPQITQPEKCQGKDRQFAGKVMQHEIHEEVQREQDLVKLGKVPGFYHKGTVRQLKERKKLFEAFQAPTVSTLPLPSRTRAQSWPFSTPNDISHLVNQETSTIRRAYVEKSPNPAKGGGSTSLAPRKPRFSEGTGSQIIIIESNLSAAAQNLNHVKPKAEATTAVDFARPNIPSHRTEEHGEIKASEQKKEEQEEVDSTPKENPFFKLRSSTNLVKVEKDIREAQEREKELLQQRMCLYGGGGGEGGGRPANLERGNTKLTRSSSLNRLPVTDSSGSLSRPVTGPPAVRQSVGKLGVWPPAQAEEGKISRPEVLNSPRKKTPLVQRWEAGLINGHSQGDD